MFSRQTIFDEEDVVEFRRKARPLVLTSNRRELKHLFSANVANMGDDRVAKAAFREALLDELTAISRRIRRGIFHNCNL